MTACCRHRSPRISFMKIYVVFVIVFARWLCLAQVTIQNPQHLPVPEQQVQALHNIICRVVVEDLHVGRGGYLAVSSRCWVKTARLPLLTRQNGIFTVYLKQWDEATFAMADLQLIVQAIVLRDRWLRTLYVASAKSRRCQSNV